MTKQAYIQGTGSYVPERVMTNADLEAKVDTSDEWITARTGIRERRIAADHETAGTMGVEAARRALAASGLAPHQIGLVVVATSTPDMVFPSTACIIQHELGISQGFSFDLSAACSGYLYALDCARQYIETGAVEYALVIGSETMSRTMDWTDRGTCILFGDGAGACVLGAGPSGGRILNIRLGSDGSLGNLLTLPGASSPRDVEGWKTGKPCLTMEGREVFKHAVHGMTDASMDVLRAAGREVADLDWIIPHQANQRIIQSIQKHMGLPSEKFVLNLDRYGNTSAASLILALDEVVQEKKIAPGDLVLFVVFGGGFTWGAGLVEWSE